MTGPTRRRRAGAAALAGAALLATGTACGSSGAGTAGGAPRTGGTIVYGHVQEPPCVFGGWIQQAYLSRQVLDGLVTLADDGSVKPWLATSWTVSPDGTRYTFTLEDGVRFTDGTPVDAAAIAWNFDLWMTKDGNSTAKVSLDPYYRSARALDARRVEISLNSPYPPFLTLITQGYFGIQSPTAFQRRSEKENCEKPIGSGGFTVKEWKRGEEVVLAKNPDYTSWPATARHEGPAIVDEVRWKFIADGVSRYSSLGTGESHVVYEVPTVNWKDAQSRYQTIRYITPGKPVSFYINTRVGPFRDKLVRQAFAYGADRKSAVEAGFHGVIPYEGNPAVSQSTPGYDAEVAKSYAYDPGQANELLDRAGWTGRDADGIRTRDGQPLRVTLVYGSGFIFTQEGATVLQVLKEQWKQVGLDVELVPATQAELWGGKFSDPGTFDATPSYWTSPSPAILWIVWRPDTKDAPNYSNRSFYNNETLARTIQRANAEPDAAQANALYGQAQRIIQDDAAGIGLYTQNSTYAIARDLQDVWLEKSQGEPVFSDAYFTG